VNSVIIEQVLVLGAKGFIGSAICRYLQNQQVSLSAPSSEECNLLNLTQTKNYLRRFKKQKITVVLGAAIPRRVDDSPETMQKNIQMVTNFIQGSEMLHIKSLIFLSSIDVYGKAEVNPIVENLLPSPDSYYAVAKICSEYLLKEAWGSYSLAILRLPGVYGKGDNGNSIVGMFAKKIQDGTKLTLTNNGTVLRDYVAVMDICKIVVSFLHEPCSGTFNIATGNSMKIGDIAHLIGQLLGCKTNIALIEKDNIHFDVSISNRKLCETFPNFYFTPMENGICNYISEFSS
jgi:UDP-glucose 4-epimerase